MATRDEFRLRIQDKAVPVQQTFVGDGSKTIYFLDSIPVVAASETIIVGGTTYTQDATPEANQYNLSDDTGKVIFGVAPVAGTFGEMDWTTTVFTDTEIDNILDDHSITGSGSTTPSNADFYAPWRDVVEVLMMDAQKMFKWSAAGGHDIDQSFIFRNLEKLREMIDNALREDTVTAGGLESWSVQQENFD